MSQDIIDYPYPLDLRWNYLPYLPVFPRSFLTSPFMFWGDLEVKGAALCLWCESWSNDPPATLPTDAKLLAAGIRLTLEQWLDLAAREWSPLHGWIKVRCGAEVRQTHPMLLKALEAAVVAGKLRQRGTRKREMWQPPDAGRRPKDC